MRGLASEIVFGTLVAIIAFLVLKDASQFGTAVKAVSGGYAESVKALQGR